MAKYVGKKKKELKAVFSLSILTGCSLPSVFGGYLVVCLSWLTTYEQETSKKMTLLEGRKRHEIAPSDGRSCMFTSTRFDCTRWGSHAVPSRFQAGTLRRESNVAYHFNGDIATPGRIERQQPKYLNTPDPSFRCRLPRGHKEFRFL